jgi:hydroxymethylpyrimidine/phosphomethylpyrimidine kinase
MKNILKLKKVLTIAGSDSGGGAGIQADLKTFAACGVYGMSAITAVTAQNTVGVQGVYELPASFVGQQIDSVMDDIGADAVKIGMLSNQEIIDVVTDRIIKYAIKLVVLDPVMIAKSGDSLLKSSATNSLIKKLIPLSFVVTPNIDEAKVITGIEINSIPDMKRAASLIYKMGCENVLVKGGHLTTSEYSTDILYDGKKYYQFKSKRIKTLNTHGTGCTFASAIAAELAKCNDINLAVKNAKKYLDCLIISSVDLGIGHGHGPMNHMSSRL